MVIRGGLLWNSMSNSNTNSAVQDPILRKGEGQGGFPSKTGLCPLLDLLQRKKPARIIPEFKKEILGHCFLGDICLSGTSFVRPLIFSKNFDHKRGQCLIKIKFSAY